MDQNNNVTAIIFNRRAYLTTLMVLMLGGTGLFLFIGVKFEILIIDILAVLIFIVTPLIFLKKILLLFEKQVTFIFEDEFFNLIVVNKLSEDEEFNENYRYDSIDFCIVYTTKTGQYSTVTIAFINGERQRYTLKSEDNDVFNLSEIIYENIKLRYPEVSLKPSILASQTGLTILRVWGLLIIALIVIHVFLSIETMPFSLIFSLAILIQIYGRRTSDIKSYERLINKN